MRKRITLLLLVLSLFLIQFASASISCSPSEISVTFEEGQGIGQQTTRCTNDGNSTVSISKVGDHFSTSETVIGANSQKNIPLDIDQNTQVGSYLGALIFSDGSNPVTVRIVVTEGVVQNGEIIIFPTSQVTTVQQGKEKTANIKILVPENYPGPIIIQQVEFNPQIDTIKFGDLSYGQLLPGQSLQIPIIYSGIDAQVGTYQTVLKILATDSNGQISLPEVNLQLQVSSGVAPPGNGTLSKPSCTLDSVVLNLNTTYLLTCSNVVVNLDVDIPYSEFFVGQSTELTSGIYKYRFRPIKFGDAFFIAQFKYLGGPLFDPFVQKVSISSLGQGIPGTDLDLSFTPNIENVLPGESTIIQVVDKSTGSLVNEPTLFIDGIPLTHSQLTFNYTFEAKNYSIRAKAVGYNDLLSNISISTKEIKITIDPETGDETTDFNITTSINSSLFINGRKESNPFFGKLPSGEVEIEAIVEGYTNSKINITVASKPKGILQGPDPFEKNKVQLVYFNKNVTWELFYKEDATELEESLGTSGTGDRAEFTPKKKGIYTLYDADGNSVWSSQIEGWSGEVFGIYWAYLLIGLVVAFGLLFYMFRKPSDDGANVVGTYRVGGQHGPESFGE